jgi:hypothetical protein
MKPETRVIRPKPFEPFDYQRLYADSASGPPLKKLATGATLAQLSDDYDLFTIAPLVLRGGLPVNPINEWMNEQGISDGVWLVPLPAPIWDLGANALSKFWASKLWACDKRIWEPLSYRLGTIAMINRDTRTFVRSLCQEIPVADVIALSKMTVLPSVCPMFTLTTFGLDGNKGVLACEPAKTPPLDKARLVKMDALPETIALAKAILGEARRPYDAASHMLREEAKDGTDDSHSPPV